MSLVCPRCQRVSALGELCPDHGLHGVTPAALSTLDDAPLLGHVLNGQFALTDLIGQGGMGTVYRGLDLTLHRELAVKVLHAHLTATRKDRERFEREARALSRLRSASTVTLYQFGVVREGPLANLAFMAMEAVEGTSLARRLSRGPVGLEEIAEILDQLADSLGEAHQLGIVHRDLKPENILLTQTHDGRLRVKTIDFGIARLDGATRSGSGLLSGTPHYMAPEQCAAAEADTLDGRVDVYAVGVILFQALTGERPFDGRDPLQILVKQVNEPVPHLPGADRPGNSQALDVVVQRALAKDKAHRYATVGELARAYRSVLSALGGAVVPLFDSPRGVAEGRSAELSDTMAAARGALEGRRPAPPRTGLRWRFVALAALASAAVAVTIALLTPPAVVGTTGVSGVSLAVAEPAVSHRLPLARDLTAASAGGDPLLASQAAPTEVGPVPVSTRLTGLRLAGSGDTPPAARVSGTAVQREAARPISSAGALPTRPLESPRREPESLVAQVDESLSHCRCAAAKQGLAAVVAQPGGPALAAARGLAARSAACVSPDVDETCVDGKVRSR